MNVNCIAHGFTYFLGAEEGYLGKKSSGHPYYQTKFSNFCCNLDYRECP